MWMASEEIWRDPAFCYSVPEPQCDSKTPASSLIHVLPLHKKKYIQLFQNNPAPQKPCMCVATAWIRTGKKKTSNKKGAELQSVVRWPRFFIKGSAVTASGNHVWSLSGACGRLSAPGRELRGSFISRLFGSSLQSATGPHCWATLSHEDTDADPLQVGNSSYVQDHFSLGTKNHLEYRDTLLRSNIRQKI